MYFSKVYLNVTFSIPSCKKQFFDIPKEHYLIICIPILVAIMNTKILLGLFVKKFKIHAI